MLIEGNFPSVELTEIPKECFIEYGSTEIYLAKKNKNKQKKQSPKRIVYVSNILGRLTKADQSKDVTTGLLMLEEGAQSSFTGTPG